MHTQHGPLAVDFPSTYAAECFQSALDVRDPDTPATLYAAAEIAGVVRAAMGGMMPRHAELLSLRYERDLTLGEIAALWGVSEPAVHAMERRALARMKLSLELMGVNSVGDFF